MEPIVIFQFVRIAMETARPLVLARALQDIFLLIACVRCIENSLNFLADCSGQNFCNEENGGGVCIAPGVCSCNSTFSGPSCEGKKYLNLLLRTSASCPIACDANQFCGTPGQCICKRGFTGDCNTTCAFCLCSWE